MYNVQCSDWAFEEIFGSGIGERIQKEIFSKHKHYSVGDEYSANSLRKLGRVIRKELGIGEPIGFDSLRGLDLALGAFVIGEYPREYMFSWRANGRKTHVSSLNGESVFLEQVNTYREEIFIPPYQGRVMMVNWGSWRYFLALALMYFRHVHPEADIRLFMEENFQAWRHPLEKALFAESMTDHELFGVPKKQYDDEPRLDRLSLLMLKDNFSRGLPEYQGKPLRAVRFGSQERSYFTYLMHNNLNIGIEYGREWGSEDQTLPEYSIEVEAFGRKLAVRDWIMFSPDEAEKLLMGCFDQYARDRAEVPEIVDYFVWGMGMEKQMESE